MPSKFRAIRYYWWVLKAFTKKHLRLIMLSFFLTFFVILSLIVFTPYLASTLSPQGHIVGIVGAYSVDELPEEVLTKISHGLVSINEKGEIVPALASSWESRDDNREFRFHLKQDLFWGDGKEFTASDITYTFSDVEMDVIDDSTVYFKLKQPLAIFPTYLSKPIVKHPLNGVAGPYKVDRTKSELGRITEIDLSPNKKDLTPITYKFYDNESELINAYKRGEITEMTLTRKNLADAFSRWKNTTIERSVDYSRVLTLFFNLNNSTLSSKEVRKAITEGILKSKFNDQGEIAQSPIPPVSWAYSDDINKTLYDPDSARKVVDRNEASASATLQFKTYYDYLSSATAINENLEQIGLATELTLISFNDPGDFDILLAFWKIPAVTDQYFFWHSTQKTGNITGYANVKVDKLLEDSRDTLSIKERKEYYDQFQKVLVDEVPASFLYYPYVYKVARK